MKLVYFLSIQNCHYRKPCHFGGAFCFRGRDMQISSKLRTVAGNGLLYWCPGCNDQHVIHHGTADDWQWDGDAERPTFRPSVLMKSGHYMSGHKPGDSCWCTYYAANPDKKVVHKCTVCHSFVRGGRIQFLGDCTHPLAGKTVDLPDLPEHLRDGTG